MIRGVSPRRTLELFPGDAAEIFPEFRRVNQLFYRAGIAGDGGADGLQVCGCGHVHAARQKRSSWHDVNVVRQPQRVPAAGSQHGGEVAFVRRLVFGEAHVVVDAKDGVLGGQIAQGLDGIEAEDQALDEVLKEQFGLVVLGAVGLKPFVVIVLAKVVKKSEDRLELGHGKE